MMNLQNQYEKDTIKTKEIKFTYEQIMHFFSKNKKRNKKEKKIIKKKIKQKKCMQFSEHSTFMNQWVEI